MRYSRKQLEFLRLGYLQMRVPELTRAFNEAFDLDKTHDQIKSTLSNHKFTCGRPTGGEKGKLRLFTRQQMVFIEEYYGDLGRKGITKALNIRFETRFTQSQVVGFIKNHKLYTERTGHFPPGHVPFNKGKKGWQAGGRSVETQFQKGEMAGAAQRNYKPIGSTRISKDGYLERKVTDDPNLVPARRWVGEHRLVWEAANGTIPDGYVVVFLDGDRLNVGLENLRCVPRGVLQYLNHTGLNQTTGEARKAAILTCEVVTLANKRAIA